jgi:1-acyl-sn-glycerol-3-phosphate acyltransferase
LNLLRAIFRPLWKIWFILCFAIPFLLLFPLFYWGLKTGRFHFVFKLKKLWARIIAHGSGLFPKISYQKSPYRLPRPCVVVGNHTSYLDIVFSVFYIDHTAIYMGKYELLKIPLFRHFFLHLDIPVNRRSLTDAHRAFTLAGKKLDEGYSQVIYPEGTISPQGKLKNFKNGAFRLAISRQVPVVPIVNFNNWKYLQNGGFLKSYGSMGRPQILVGEPISTVGMTEADVSALREKVFTFINNELQKHHVKQN